VDLVRRVLTYDRLKAASFLHSAIYVTLLTVWLVPGLHAAEFVFGMAHGIGWIVMSLACIAAVRLRVISLRLAVAVAVLGGVGPFFGTAEFVREGRRRSAAGSPARVQAQWP
jgi:pilus assembly protein TadC